MAPPRKAPKAKARAAQAWLPPPAPPKTPLPPVFPFRWACAYGEDEFGLWQAFEVKGVRQLLRWIPPGEFWMGSLDTEAERYDDETRHHVTLTQGFWLADTACTQALWMAVEDGRNPSRFQHDLNLPVECVHSMEPLADFISSLNRWVPGLEARLPSEAEWEYACRAGTQTPFWFGEVIEDDQVNFDGTHSYGTAKPGAFRQSTVPVKSFPPNGWGLYEMHGNVWEWCSDWYGLYAGTDDVDPAGPPRLDARSRKVARGGTWTGFGTHCRSAFRSLEAVGRLGDFGFRIARGP